MCTFCGFQLAAATDRRNLRFFSCGGMQRQVLSLPGPVVALAGHGKEIAVAVHISMPLPGNQAIGIAIFSVGGRKHRLPTFTPLPLAPKSLLSWIGFTDQGTVRNCSGLKKQLCSVPLISRESSQQMYKLSLFSF